MELPVSIANIVGLDTYGSEKIDRALVSLNRLQIPPEFRAVLVRARGQPTVPL